MGKPKSPKAAGFKRIASPPVAASDSNTQRVVFGFRHIVKGFDLTGADQKDAGNFIDALRMRGSITWAQIIAADHRALGCEKISAALKVPIPNVVPDAKKDIMLCFRFGGDKERFVGYREGATFEVVWIDPVGTLYNHG